MKCVKEQLFYKNHQHVPRYFWRSKTKLDKEFSVLSPRTPNVFWTGVCLFYRTPLQSNFIPSPSYDCKFEWLWNNHSNLLVVKIFFILLFEFSSPSQYQRFRNELVFLLSVIPISWQSCHIIPTSSCLELILHISSSSWSSFTFIFYNNQ